MEKEFATSSTNPDLILSSKSEDEEEEGEVEGEEEEEKNKEPKEPVRKWGSQLKCYEAYACFISCYPSFQITCLLLSNNGILAMIPSILFQIFIAVPASVIQITLGRYIMTNVSNCWSMHLMAKGILICELATTGYYIIYGLAVTSFLMKYMFLSLTIPWTSCNTSWATLNCYESQQFQKYLADCLKLNTPEFCMNMNWKTSEMEYWKYVVTNPSSAMNMFLQFFCSFLVSIILFALVVKGVRSAEKSFSFFVIITVILTIFMACIICMTSEFIDGIKQIFQIQFESLLHMQIWVEAYDVTIFVFGIGRLPLAFISSHADNENDFFSEVLVICLITIFCLLITLPSFCVMEVIKSNNYIRHTSDSLDIFILTSELVLLFPKPSKLWAILYYLLLLLITLGSLCISLLAFVETITGFMPDRFSIFYTSLIACIVCFIASLFFIFSSFNFTIYFDKSIVSILFLYLITLEIFYGLYMFLDDFHFLMGYPVPFFLKLAWIISLPVSFLMIVLSAIAYCSASINTIIYLFLAIPFFVYILSACIHIGIKIYRFKSVKNIFLNKPDWGPADPLFKKSRNYFDSRAVTKEFVYRQELREKLALKAPDIAEQSIVHVI